MLDLRNWDFDTQGAVKLEGRWHFYWQQLLTHEQIVNGDRPVVPELLTVPGSWHKQKLHTKSIPVTGFGTYHLKILLNRNDARLHLKVEELASASKLFINGILHASAGKVSVEKKNTDPKLLIDTIDFIPATTTLDIVIQVANFHDSDSGITRAITLGKKAHFRQDFVNSLMLRFLFGSFFIMGLYHLMFYLTRKVDLSPLFFSLICFDMALRMLVRDRGILLNELFSNLPFVLANRFDFITFYLGPGLFSLFIYSLFPRFFSRALLYLIVLISFGFALYVVFSPANAFWMGLRFFQIFALLAMSYNMYVLIRSAISKQESALTFITGSLIFFLLAAYDTISSMFFTSGAQISPYGLFIFLFSQAYMLSRRFSNSLLRSENLVNSYQRFVPQAFLQQLGKKEIMDVRLGDCVKAPNMSILFSDIRAFTALSEKMTPQENFEFLNGYLKKMEPAITQNNGVIDKYIGDAVMAIFPTSADDALSAAIYMHHNLRAFNAERVRCGIAPIKIGIGINTGDMMLGTIGAEKRMEGTVISDAVNLAARLESLTKIYQANILISEKTLNCLSKPEQFDFRVADKVIVKGKSTPVTIFEVFTGDPENIAVAKRNSLKDFNAAIDLYYQKQFGSALVLFQRCLNLCGDDQIANIYVRRCKHYIEHGCRSDWDGVEHLEIK